IRENKVQKVKATDASTGDTDNSGIVSNKGDNQTLENQSNTSRDESNRSRNECNDKSTSGDDTDVRPSYDTESMTENKEIELKKYKTYLNHTTEYDTLERKLKETQTILAQKENDIKEGLKLKAYEVSVVKKEHDELVKHSLLTKSRYKGLIKEKNQVIKDLKLKEENDIDKMITIEKQLKFLNEIVYKRNQSIQTIHMLAPKGSTYNGRPTFANPMYLKKTQSEKSCLYEISYDKSDIAKMFAPNREETLTLEQESRSKLNKDLVKPYCNNPLFQGYAAAVGCCRGGSDDGDGGVDGGSCGYATMAAAVKGGGARCRDSGGWDMMILGGGRSGSEVRRGCCGVVGVESDDGGGVVVGWRWWRLVVGWPESGLDLVGKSGAAPEKLWGGRCVCRVCVCVVEMEMK
ncbi:hypothetical protein Tco_0304718, partial [Tanacetum coccineum]